VAVSLLPKKPAPEWQDTPLPGLEEVPTKHVREKSKKDEDDDAHKIKYRRYRGARSIVCHDCAYEGSAVVASATHIRIYQGLERYLCSAHATHRRDITDQKRGNG
jgi:hypothetical protein